DTDWVRAFNALFRVLDESGTPTYYSGGRFLSKVREVDPYFPNYKQFIDHRKASNQSTSRRDYFYDILRDFDRDKRVRIIQLIVDDIQRHEPARAQDIRSMIEGGPVRGPMAEITSDAWSADRLAHALDEIDDSITNRKYERAVTLSYTSLEGYYKA